MVSKNVGPVSPLGAGFQEPVIAASTCCDQLLPSERKQNKDGRLQLEDEVFIATAPEPLLHCEAIALPEPLLESWIGGHFVCDCFEGFGFDRFLVASAEAVVWQAVGKWL